METLTLEQAYYIGELIAAVVVIISLIYLALQVRTSNQTSLIESLATFSPRLDRCFEFLTIPENAKLYLAAADNYADLDEEQKLRYRSYVRQLMNVMEDFYLMSKVDVYVGEPGDRRSLFHDVLSTPGGRQAWKEIRVTTDADFREVMDAISEAKGDKDFVY